MLPERLIRRKRFPMDERTESGETVNELMARVLLSREPQPPAQPPIQPISRIPVTDTLPAEIGFRSPESGYEAATQPPITRFKLADAPLEAQNIPLQEPELAKIIPFKSERGVMVGAPLPEEMVAPPSERVRLTQPVDQLLKATENAQALRSMPIDYGQDSQGNQRIKPKGGWSGRTLSALKRLGMGMLQGKGLLGAGADAIEGAIDPGINARERRQREIGMADQEAATQIGLAGQQAKLADLQATADWKRIRPQLEIDKATKKAAYQEWLMKHGDRRQDTYENWLQFKREMGLRQQDSTEDFREWQEQSFERRQAEIERHNQVSEELGRGNLGVRQESNQIRRETGGRTSTGSAAPDQAEVINSTVDRQVTELKKEQAQNEAIANDPNRADWERRDARNRATKIRDKIGSLELKKKAPRSRSSSPQGRTPVQGRVSRGKFVQNNPGFKGKSQAEIDAAIRGAGYEPY